MSDISSVKGTSAYLSMMAALAAENVNASAASLSADTAAINDAVALQRLRGQIALAMLAKDRELSDAAREVEPRDEEAIKPIETFDRTLRAGYYASEDGTVYLEVEDEDGRKAYEVDTPKVDRENMSRFEAMALIGAMQSDPQWSDITYTDMLNAISTLFGRGGKDADKQADIVDQIGQYVKPTYTYNKSGNYNLFENTGVAALFDTNRELREAERAIKLRALMDSISTGDGGKRTLAKGVYL